MRLLYVAPERFAAPSFVRLLEALPVWAELMRRSFDFDVLTCPRCGGRLELIALIEDPTVIRRILSHLGLPTDVPAARPARPPPLPIGRSDPWYDEDVSVP